MVHEMVQHKKAAFLETFAKLGNVTRSAQAVGIDRKMHYYWLEHDEEYREQYQESLSTFKGLLDFECFRRGVLGIDEPVVYQGQISVHRDAEGQPIIDPETRKPIPVTVRKFSDTLLIVKMKQHGVFVDRQEHGGFGGGPVEHAVRVWIPHNNRDALPPHAQKALEAENE